MNSKIDTIRRVFPEDCDGNFIEIGPWPEGPDSVLELRTVGESSQEWFGKISLTMEPNFARALATALIAAADDMDKN